MSIKHIQAVLESGLPGNLKMVAITYADCADTDTGECWPSYDTVAKRASISRRQAIRNAQKLEGLGVLIKVASKAVPGGDLPIRQVVLGALPKSDYKALRMGKPGERYKAYIDGVSEQHDQESIAQLLGLDVLGLRGDNMSLVTSDTLGVTPTTPPGVTPMSPEPSINHHKNHHGQNEFDLAFKLFWEVYPKKVKKQPARMAFDKAAKAWGNTGCDREDVDGWLFKEMLVKDIASRIAKDRQWKPKSPFIPDPTTYLNQARWEDEIQEVTEHDKPKVVVPAPVPANDDRLLEMARENGIPTYGMFRKDLANALREKLGA